MHIMFPLMNVPELKENSGVLGAKFSPNTSFFFFFFFNWENFSILVFFTLSYIS